MYNVLGILGALIVEYSVPVTSPERHSIALFASNRNFPESSHAMSAHEYETAILTCNDGDSDRVFEEVADQFAFDLIGMNKLPDDYFNLVLNAVSDSRFYGKKGVWKILLALGTENDNVTEQHYNQLSDQIISNYRKYNDEMLCLTVCDFIARNYCLTRARAIFDLLDDIENQKPPELRGFVQDGRRIMLNEEMRRIE